MQSTITDEILSAGQKDGTSQDGQVHAGSEVESQIRAINEALADKLGQQKYRIWFKNSTKLILAGGYLKVGVPNLFIANWIIANGGKVLPSCQRQQKGAARDG